jgi:CRP/FNR family transcriptional regulator
MNKKEAAVINISSVKAACRDCSLRELCLPVGLGAEELRELDRLIKRRRTLRKGELLYRFGDPFHALYAIRRGALKTTGLMEDGRVQVTGFYLPSELLGTDAINADQYPCSAEALETSEVCEIPYSELEALAGRLSGLRHQLLRIMSREIVRDERQLMLLGRMTAEERLASFLLGLSRRQARLGMSPTELRLTMSRQDIGDYLGLALETVSRLFSRFQDDGLIGVHGRQIQVRDLARVDALATGASDGQIQRA